MVDVRGARVRVVGCGLEKAAGGAAGSAAVGVFGKASQLYISGTSICNEEGDGLKVSGGALAVVQRECYFDSIGNGLSGGSGLVADDEGTRLVCVDSSSSFNSSSNARVARGAMAFFTRCR